MPYIVLKRWPLDLIEHLQAQASLNAFILGPQIVPTLQAFADVVETVVQMHRDGYAHLDIKPDNILLDLNAPKIKGVLIDYGSSQRNPGKIRPGTVGTRGDFDERKPYSMNTDVYGLSIVLEQILTLGQGTGLRKRFVDVLDQWRNQVPLDLTDVIASYFSEIKILIGESSEGKVNAKQFQNTFGKFLSKFETFQKMLRGR